MRSRIVGAFLVALVPFLSLSALSASAADARGVAAQGRHEVSTQVTGKFTASHGNLKGPGTFTGTLALRHFVVQNSHLVAQGVINGTLKDATGKTEKVTNQPFQAVVQSFGNAGTTLDSANASRALQGSCTILTLNLGPLHLNLLGLVVDLSAVHLTITGQQGPGNLLGNLLCGIAGLANGGLGGLGQTLLQDIAMILNQVLANL